MKASSRRKGCAECYAINSKQCCSNPPDPLRDASEKSEGFPRGARETMVARYKRLQLGVIEWRAKRKALGFFVHVTGQVSGCRETSLSALAIRTVRKYGVNPQSLAEHIMDAEQINTIGSKLTDLAARTLDLRGYL
jgi:hypothetical protein